MPVSKPRPAAVAKKAAPRKAPATAVQGQYTLGSGGSQESLFDLTLPSGKTCQARRPGPQGLIAAGLLDSFDELTALVKTEHLDTKTAGGIAALEHVTAADTAAATKAFMADPSKLAAAFTMIDRLTAYIVTQPPVWVDYRLKDESDDDWNVRQEAAAKIGAIAVRVIDLDDKMFLLNWAMGGSADLTSFRQGSETALANLATG